MEGVFHHVSATLCQGLLAAAQRVPPEKDLGSRSPTRQVTGLQNFLDFSGFGSLIFWLDLRLFCWLVFVWLEFFPFFVCLARVFLLLLSL